MRRLRLRRERRRNGRQGAIRSKLQVHALVDAIEAAKRSAGWLHWSAEQSECTGRFVDELLQRLVVAGLLDGAASTHAYELTADKSRALTAWRLVLSVEKARGA